MLNIILLLIKFDPGFWALVLDYIFIISMETVRL